MKKYRFLLFFGGILAVIGGLFWFGQANKDRPLDAKQLNALGLVQFDFPRVVEDIELLNHQGEPFDKSKLTGKWTYAFFGYVNCPDICPVTMHDLERTWNRLRDTLAPEKLARFQGMFVTVDPSRDGVEEVREFVERYSDSFLGVTGTEANIATFARQVGIAYRRIPSASELLYLVEHQGNIVIFDPHGDCFGYIKPPFDTIQLTKLFEHLATQG